MTEEFRAPAQRIASLLASGTEILYALGLGDHVVAVSHECDFPDEARSKPRVTRTHVDASTDSRAIDEQVRKSLSDQSPLYEVDGAALAALRPDLIVTQAQCDVCAVDLDDLLRTFQSHPVLRGTRSVALNPATLNGVLDDILRVAESAGVPERGQSLVDELANRVESVRRRTQRLAETDRPRVVCLEWIEPVMVAANWMPELVEIAGGRCPLTTAGQRSGYSSWDAIADFDPQVVVVMPCGFDRSRTLKEAAVLPSTPSWSTLSAVRNGRVYAVDGNAYFNRSGPRLVDSLELLSNLVHPTLDPSSPWLKPGVAWARLE